MKKFWLNLPIRFKILSYYFIVIVLLFVSLIIANDNNKEVVEQFNDTIDQNLKVYRTMEKTSQDITDVERYLFSNDVSALESYLGRKDEIILLIEDMLSSSTSVESYFRINAIYYSERAYKKLFDNAIQEKAYDNPLFYEQYYRGLAIRRYTDQYFNELLLENLKEQAKNASILKSEANAIRKTTYNLILITGALALVLGIILSNYIVVPIKKLSDYSRKISQGQLDIIEVNTESKDEIGDLSSAFNHMGISIKSYVEKIKEQANMEKKLHAEEKSVMQIQQLLQQSKLEALQAKINPHFLFNTLNVIIRTALFENAHETMELIQLLAKIFRYQLRSAGERVSLEEEKMIITDYLELQKARFKERLQYEIDIPSDIDIYIPVLTLQPLVENAITHGIGPKIDGGCIKIKAYEKEDKVYVIVSDDGIGMNKALVQKINQDLDIDIKNKVSIGIRNVRDRFLLSFPNNSEFIVDSEINVGTSVKMIITRQEV